MISDQFPAVGSDSIQSNLSVLEDQYCDLLQPSLQFDIKKAP
jgi:hypothetical protein